MCFEFFITDSHYPPYLYRTTAPPCRTSVKNFREKLNSKFRQKIKIIFHILRFFRFVLQRTSVEKMQIKIPLKSFYYFLCLCYTCQVMPSFSHKLFGYFVDFVLFGTRPVCAFAKSFLSTAAAETLPTTPE